MPIRRETYITRQMLQNEPDTLFVFSDTLIGKGSDGHAQEMRGEPNAVGIPTKKLPTMDPSAFFVDGDEGFFLLAAEPPFRRLTTHLQAGGIVVWPAAGIGTGAADLQTRAPIIWARLERAREILFAWQ
ncbi:hypothetical protein FF100_28305 [Methylobacterium terricola]|uniref:DUF7831 domain-containing protein n=1 Tax=Methylobacterium terricola TaxID=2583531 RepID=A0A5C4L9F7_9HYPH|nr:hypothetical protein [Methylobacterium terricola]TNC08749.1 hypothetical protein FF100_28305 [Methylobacterium terricola]